MSWEEFFKIEEKKDYYKILKKNVNSLYLRYDIEPRKENIFRVFRQDLKNIKVVIIGQDPYPGKGIATGLAFATNNNILTHSLRNIFLNIKKYEGIENKDTSLLNWEKEGVFLLNRNLITKVGFPKELDNIGFLIFTENVIRYINDNLENVCFILWGRDAISIEKLISKEKHYIIKSTHPSPLSFKKDTKNLKSFINTPFTKLCNNYLKKIGKEEINWQT